MGHLCMPSGQEHTVHFQRFRFISARALDKRQTCKALKLEALQAWFIQCLDLSFAMLDANSLDFSGNSHRRSKMKFLSSYECILIALLKPLAGGNDFWLCSLSNFSRTLIRKQNWLKWMAQTLVWTLIFNILLAFHPFSSHSFLPLNIWSLQTSFLSARSNSYVYKE